jgi:hypothetical protein
MEILQLIAPTLTAMRGIAYILRKLGFFRVANITEPSDLYLVTDLSS